MPVLEYIPGMESSISLPNWQLYRLKKIAGKDIRKFLESKYQLLIRYSARSFLVSERQVLYNRGEYSYSKLSVRWDIEMFNRLRAAAHRLRVSLSYLIHLVLLEQESEDAVSEGSYHRFDSFHSYFGLKFIEIIHFPRESSA